MLDLTEKNRTRFVKNNLQRNETLGITGPRTSKYYYNEHLQPKNLEEKN